MGDECSPPGSRNILASRGVESPCGRKVCEPPVLVGVVDTTALEVEVETRRLAQGEELEVGGGGRPPHRSGEIRHQKVFRAFSRVWAYPVVQFSQLVDFFGSY